MKSFLSLVLASLMGFSLAQSLPEVPAADVQAFVAQAQRGGRVVLRSGIYRLNQPLVLGNPVELVGAGSDKTVLASRAEGQVIRFNSTGKSSATGIAFEHLGTAQAYVVDVRAGEVTLTDVAVSGAVRDEANRQGGSGIIVWNNSKLTLNKSSVFKNQLEGIAALDQSQLVISDSDISENEGSGVVLYDSSTAQIVNSLLEKNGSTGIEVLNKSKLSVEKCDIRQNAEFGIFVRGTASAAVKDNGINGNTYSGILARDQAQVSLENNDILGNKESGIFYLGSATGVVRSNLIEKNTYSGIKVSEKARPLIENNMVRGNNEFGLVADKDAVVTVRQNTFDSNGYSGILARDNVQAILERNLLQNNGEHGILFVGNAGGRAQGNECKQNKLTDLYLEKSSNPTLGTNACKLERQP